MAIDWENFDLKKTKTYLCTFANIRHVFEENHYKAGHIGVTPPSKHIIWNGKQYHMRSLTIDRPYSYALREAVKNGEAIVVKGLRRMNCAMLLIV